MQEIYDINEVPDNSTIIAFFEFNYGDEFDLKEQWLCNKEEYIAETKRIEIEAQNSIRGFIEIPFGSNQDIRIRKLSAYYFVIVDENDVDVLKKYFNLIANDKILNRLFEYFNEGEE